MSSIDPHLEAQYNNRAKVPDHSAIMAGWRERSERARSRHEHAEIGLAYGKEARHTVDVFQPDAGRDAPLAVFLHGGYWQALDKSWFSHLASGFNARGMALAVPSYRLCPGVPLDAVVDDARLALVYLMRRYRRDVVVCGHSAGGHLTAMILATDWTASDMPYRPLGGVAISGLFDLRPLVRTSINAALALDDAEAWRLSPASKPAPSLPLAAFVGSREGEEYERQSDLIASSWRGASERVPGADHFTAIAPLEDGQGPLMDAIVAMAGSATGMGERA